MAPRPQYERGFSFAAFQANQPKKSLPGQRVDIELDEIADRLTRAGASAYELAVLRGFDGTEDEYLASLVGPPGVGDVKVAFPLKDGGAERNLVDRSRDYIVLADCGTDNDGSPASDQRKLLDAISQAQERPGAAVLVDGRDQYIATSELQLTKPQNWRFIAYGATRAPLVGTKVVPVGSMRSVFNVQGTDGVVFHDLMGYNPVNPSQVLNFSAVQPGCVGGADALIRIEKTGTDAEVILRNCQGYGFPYLVDFVDGIRLNIDGLRGQNCALAVNIRNNGIDSKIKNVANEYGSAIKTNIDASRSGSGPNGGKQGAEGLQLQGIRSSQTVAPAFGYKQPGIWLRGGFAYRLSEIQPQQMYYSDAVLIDGTEFNILDVMIHAMYADCQTDDGAYNALNASGQVDGLSVFGIEANGFTGYATVLNGTSAVKAVFKARIFGGRFFDNKLGDLLSNQATAAIFGCHFGSAAGIYEFDTSIIKGYANHFQTAPQRKSAFSTWEENEGPGAFIGYPADISQLAPGNKYLDTVGGVPFVLRAKGA